MPLGNQRSDVLSLASLAQRSEAKLALVRRPDFLRMLRILTRRVEPGIDVLLLELLASPEVARLLARDRELVSSVAARCGDETLQGARFGTALALLMDFDEKRVAKERPGMTAWEMAASVLSVWNLAEAMGSDLWRWENTLSCLKRVAEAKHCGFLVDSADVVKALLKRRLTQCLAYVVAREPSRSSEGDACAARFAFLSVDVLGTLVESGVVRLDDVVRSLVAFVVGVVVPRGLSENAVAWDDVRRRALAVAMHEYLT